MGRDEELEAKLGFSEAAFGYGISDGVAREPAVEEMVMDLTIEGALSVWRRGWRRVSGST